jgi:nucleotide-binding universal stress UspA family protein
MRPGGAAADPGHNGRHWPGRCIGNVRWQRRPARLDSKGSKDMFDELILAIEGTEKDLAVLPMCSGLARQLDVPLTVLSVVPDTSQASEREERLTSDISRRGLDAARVEVMEGGDPADALIVQLRLRSGALCCMPTHARPPMGEAVFGSVAAKVVRGTSAPIVLFGPGLSDTWGERVENLMVCLDTSPLSEAILPVAAQFARRSGARLWLVEVISPHQKGTGMSGPDVAGEASYVRQQADKLRREHDVRAEWEVLHGDDPARTIADYAAGMAGTLIAMTTHGRSGMSQIIAGSVAQSTIRNARCPVLVVRPNG